MSSEVGEKRLFDNKQLIHIASEVVVLIGLTFYFSSKNRKLLTHVEDLAQRLEEQEDKIQKMENTLQQIGQNLRSLPFDGIAKRLEGHEKRMMGIENLVGSLRPQQTSNHRTRRKRVSKQRSPPEPQIQRQFHAPHGSLESVMENPPSPPERSRQVQINNKIDYAPEESISEEELEDSDLDDEIREELEELEADSGLKKQD